ncbi:2-dehydro-3-deoxygalactonokinase [Cribrihabitans neustonicus]|uniref:2-dehydro-3-deoxygalactonokinase n=1 Tax=Cribrihabitans neustonicus TaxID=1429085 RepID=UPI003B5A62B3
MQADRPRPDWIAASVDGEALTLWPMQGGRAGVPLRRGLAGTGPSALAAGLQAALADLPGAAAVPLLLSGGGLASPRSVPAAPGTLVPEACELEGLHLLALPGLSQSAPGGLMQGAETCLAGFFALNPDWDGAVCLPGMVSHWVQASAREAVSFQSALTPVLARAALVQAGLAEDTAWDSAALKDAAADGIAKPEMLAARLAAAQADLALGRLPGAEAAGRMWGLLLGAELAAAKPYWLGQNAALIAAGRLQPLYAAALEAQGLPFTVAEPERLALAGLTQAWARLQDKSGEEAPAAGRLH